LFLGGLNLTRELVAAAVLLGCQEVSFMLTEEIWKNFLNALRYLVCHFRPYLICKSEFRKLVLEVD
jgi:hypothetical protein